MDHSTSSIPRSTVSIRGRPSASQSHPLLLPLDQDLIADQHIEGGPCQDSRDSDQSQCISQEVHRSLHWLSLAGLPLVTNSMLSPGRQPPSKRPLLRVNSPREARHLSPVGVTALTFGAGPGARYLLFPAFVSAGGGDSSSFRVIGRSSPDRSSVIWWSRHKQRFGRTLLGRRSPKLCWHVNCIAGCPARKNTLVGR